MTSRSKPTQPDPISLSFDLALKERLDGVAQARADGDDVNNFSEVVQSLLSRALAHLRQGAQFPTPVVNVWPGKDGCRTSVRFSAEVLHEVAQVRRTHPMAWEARSRAPFIVWLVRQALDLPAEGTIMAEPQNGNVENKSDGFDRPPAAYAAFKASRHRDVGGVGSTMTLAAPSPDVSRVRQALDLPAEEVTAPDSQSSDVEKKGDGFERLSAARAAFKANRHRDVGGAGLTTTPTSLTPGVFMPGGAEAPGLDSRGSFVKQWVSSPEHRQQRDACANKGAEWIVGFLFPQKRKGR